ncbi:MAG: zinc-dependent alcohol dehydrogenase family protein [Candidatus Dormibacteraeota bacterium]|nr:zinc-dependent alcohol dehydrogenase family protein [Candidatus Dormibacteraeota bacterium]MBV8445254.1 zinc-dependent alcohol dehydrogenase family protein [Candidatus Dormibacteraeota bacterium]
MRAVVLRAARAPLELQVTADPTPGTGQVLIAVHVCAVCRTDLHVADGELQHPKLPLVLGHQIVGTVVALGEGATRFTVGARVGVPWLGWTDGTCRYCRSGRENLCTEARFTGYQLDGGYAELTVADERFCFAVPEEFGDVAAAPLLCGGLIGYRAYRMAGEGERIGLYGFGSAAHMIIQVARHEGRRVFAFTRDGDTASQEFARQLGAEWAGGSGTAPPEPLDGSIIFAPVGGLVPLALSRTAAGGVVVCAGIHMSDIPSFAYDLLWEERTVRSVANLTRADGQKFLSIAAQIPVHTETTVFYLERTADALEYVRSGSVRGTAVVRVSAG